MGRFGFLFDGATYEVSVGEYKDGAQAYSVGKAGSIISTQFIAKGKEARGLGEHIEAFIELLKDNNNVFAFGVVGFPVKKVEELRARLEGLVNDMRL